MEKLISIIFLACSFLTATSQSNIVKAEYFFDVDPGFGNANNIPLTPGIDIQNVSLSADIGSLSQGVHNLYLRSKNASGNWSITNRKVIYKPIVILAVSNLIKVEYFFDTDPGFGNAINFPITPGVNLQNLNLSADISSLSAGVHNLYLRSKNANGNWSITNRKIIYKPNSGVAASNIIKAEYFFGTDPGFGNGTDIPITPGTNVQNVSFTAPVGGGILFIRTKNANGNWSITNVFTSYTFSGNGSWDTTSNWVNNLMAPTNIPSGTQVIIAPAGQCFQTDDIITQPQSRLTIQPNKTLSLNGNLANAGIIEGAGTLNLASGTSTLSSSGIIAIPLVLFAKQLILSGDLIAASSISLTNGSNIQLGNSNLKMDTFSLVADNQNFIVTSGLGTLNRRIAGSPVTFPIGVNSTSFTPVTITNTGTSDVLDVRVANGVLTRAAITPITQGSVNRTWVMSKEAGSQTNINLSMQWNLADEQPGFDRTQAFIAMVCPPPPNCLGGYESSTPSPATGTNPYSITRNSVSYASSSDSFIVRTSPLIYTFVGSGNWTTSSNWTNNLVPPNIITAGMEVNINPSSGTCTYVGNIILQPGGKLTLSSGKALSVTGSIIIQ